MSTPSSQGMSPDRFRNTFERMQILNTQKRFPLRTHTTSTQRHSGSKPTTHQQVRNTSLQTKYHHRRNAITSMLPPLPSLPIPTIDHSHRFTISMTPQFFGSFGKRSLRRWRAIELSVRLQSIHSTQRFEPSVCLLWTWGVKHLKVTLLPRPRCNRHRHGHRRRLCHRHGPGAYQHLCRSLLLLRHHRSRRL